MIVPGTKTVGSRIVVVMAVLLTAGVGRAADPIAQRVLVVGIDGLSPAGIRQAATPVLDRLCQEGSWTMHARAVMPTSSSSNWASMIMGAGPEQHGVTSNDWERDSYGIAPLVRGPEGIFPTIFGAVRQHDPQGAIGVFHDWDGFGRLVEKQSCNVVQDGDGPVDTTQWAINFIREKKPIFTFVHLDHVDHAGHSHGWGSAEYVQAVEQADRLIGQLLEVLDETGLRGETLVLVTADHGGLGTKHGGDTMEELEIPWIAAGPGVAKGREITAAVNQYDTAATIAYALGVAAPECWIARPVTAAFQEEVESAAGQ